MYMFCKDYNLKSLEKLILVDSVFILLQKRRGDSEVLRDFAEATPLTDARLGFRFPPTGS